MAAQLEFRIDISARLASATYGEHGGEPREEIRDVELPKDRLTLDTAKLLESWLNVWDRIGTTNFGLRQALLKPDTFKVVGAHLWNLILDNDIGTSLAAKINKQPDPPLRVLINFDDYTSTDLRSLPWEFLCLPNTDVFLAAHTKLLLTRYTPMVGLTGNVVEPARDRLGVLFVTALPRRSRYDKVNERVRHFRRQLQEQPGLDVGDRLVEGLVPGEIEGALGDEARPCHIVHITGLCRGEPGKPELYLESDGRLDWQGPRPLLDALTPPDGQSPRLVILQLCEDEEGDASENFERLAPELIRRGIPAVLAMQYTLPAEDQGGVWTKFYQNLAKGMSVGKAVQTSRHGLLHGRDPNREFGTPVLYLREDGPLVQQSDATLRSATETAKGLAAVNSRPGGQLRPVLVRALQEYKKQRGDFINPRTIRTAEDWLGGTDLSGEVWEARKKLFAFAREHDDDGELAELCRSLARSLTEFEERRSA